MHKLSRVGTRHHQARHAPTTGKPVARPAAAPAFSTRDCSSDKRALLETAAGTSADGGANRPHGSDPTLKSIDPGKRAVAQPADDQQLHDLLRAPLLSRHRASPACSGFLAGMQQSFTYLGLEPECAAEIGSWVIEGILQDRPFAEIEREILGNLKAVVVDPVRKLKLMDALDLEFAARDTLVFCQLAPYLQHIKGKGRVDEMTILNVGAGHGNVAQKIFDEVSPNTFGIDICPRGKTRIPIQQFYGHTVPFPDASFDAIVSTDALRHASDRQQCLSEFHRVLRPGGKLLAHETVPPGSSEQEAMENMRLALLLDYFLGRLLQQAKLPLPGNYDTREGLAKRLEGLDFTVWNMVDAVPHKLGGSPHVIVHAVKPTPIVSPPTQWEVDRRLSGNVG